MHGPELRKSSLPFYMFYDHDGPYTPLQKGNFYINFLRGGGPAGWGNFVTASQISKWNVDYVATILYIALKFHIDRVGFHREKEGAHFGHKVDNEY